MPPLKSTQVPVASPVVVLREEFDEWAVLYNPDSAAAVGINQVGVAVWRLMDGTRSIDQIVAEIPNAFSDVPDAATADITEFVGKLAEDGFVGLEAKATSR